MLTAISPGAAGSAAAPDSARPARSVAELAWRASGALPSHAVELWLLCAEIANLEEALRQTSSARGALESEAAGVAAQLRAKQREARRGREQALSLAKHMTSLEVALVEVRALPGCRGLGLPGRRSLLRPVRPFVCLCSARRHELAALSPKKTMRFHALDVRPAPSPSSARTRDLAGARCKRGLKVTPHDGDRPTGCGDAGVVPSGP